MLGKILSQRQGFKCNGAILGEADGTINPKRGESLSHPEALDSAEAIVMSLRFRHWDDATMRKFERSHKTRRAPHCITDQYACVQRIRQGAAPGNRGITTLTGGWGKRVLGETWVSHWGKHKVEATRGETEPGEVSSPLLRGVKDVFGDSDVYEAYPPADARHSIARHRAAGHEAGRPRPLITRSDRASDRVEQPVNQPAMPVAWTREITNSAGTMNRVFCTTLGAATDLKNEGLRRLVVNAVFWGLKLEAPASTDVAPVDAYEPLMYGFDGFRRGIKAADHALGPQSCAQGMLLRKPSRPPTNHQRRGRGSS
jgi:hypothetical protein